VLGLTCSYVGPGGEACVRGVESRGYCSTHVRELRASGALAPLRGEGGPGRLPARLPGGQPGNRSRSSPLTLFKRRGVLPARTRRAVEAVALRFVESLGGAANLSAQEALLIELAAATVGKYLLAVDEVEKNGAFSTNGDGVRTVGAGYAAALKAASEIRQQLSLLGLAKRSAPALTLTEYLSKRASGELAADAPVPAEVVEKAPEDPTC
jgi:hypothetical protein